MSRANTKAVRKIVQSQFDSWVSYNDIRKDKKTRRIKFMRNGYVFTPEEYKAWAAEISRQLVEAGIWHRDAGFKQGECWRGEYVYYSVVVEA